MISKKAIIAGFFSAIIGVGMLAMPVKAMARDWDHDGDSGRHEHHDKGRHTVVATAGPTIAAITMVMSEGTKAAVIISSLATDIAMNRAPTITAMETATVTERQATPTAMEVEDTLTPPMVKAWQIPVTQASSGAVTRKAIIAIGPRAPATAIRKPA